MNIPDEILNMDPSELADSSSENDAQQQMSEDTADVSRTVNKRFSPLRELCQSDNSVKFKTLAGVYVIVLKA